MSVAATSSRGDVRRRVIGRGQQTFPRSTAGDRKRGSSVIVSRNGRPVPLVGNDDDLVRRPFHARNPSNTFVAPNHSPGFGRRRRHLVDARAVPEPAQRLRWRPSALEVEHEQDAAEPASRDGRRRARTVKCAWRQHVAPTVDQAPPSSNVSRRLPLISRPLRSHHGALARMPEPPAAAAADGISTTTRLRGSAVRAFIFRAARQSYNASIPTPGSAGPPWRVPLHESALSARPPVCDVARSDRTRHHHPPERQRNGAAKGRRRAEYGLAR